MRRPKIFSRRSKGESALYIFVSIIFAIVAASYVYLFLWAIIAGAKTHTEIVVNPFATIHNVSVTAIPQRFRP